jgi:sugar/nucleoside kinase (ribokinase family)
MITHTVVAGADAAGKQMLEHLRILGADTSAVVVSNAHGTGTYLAVLDEKGDLFATVADMDVNNVLNAESVMASITSKTPIVMLDANISQATVEAVCRHCHTLQVPVWFEPTSATKGMRGLPSFIDGLVQFVSPSLQETERWLEALDKRGAARGGEDPIARGKEDVRVLLGSIAHPRPGVTYTVVQKLGEDGVVLGRWLADSGPAATHSRFWHIPAARLPSLKNTSGAGKSI